MTELAATPQDFRRALLAVRDAKGTKLALWESGVKMLVAQYRGAGHTATMAELAAGARSDSENAARLHYGSFAQLVARALGYTPPKDVRKPMWWMAIATSSPESESEDAARYTMRPELAQAIELMGWVKA